MGLELRTIVNPDPILQTCVYFQFILAIMTATDVATVTSQSGKDCPNSKEASPVKVKTPAEVQEEATTHLATGKRHLLVSDIPSAVSSLAQACELFSGHFGETAKECAESYFYYGKALLELSRLESGVLGNALEGVPEGDDANNSRVEDPEKMTEDEKNEVEQKVGEALEENFDSLQKKDEKADESKDDKSDKTSESQDNEASGIKAKEADTTEEEGMEEDTNDSKGKEVDADKSTTEGEENTESQDSESDEKKEGDEEEEPSNLQLAWEMLELAKVVYTKQVESAENAETGVVEKLCSTILLLGETSMENENYSQAVEDIQLCLKKQDCLPKDSRVVAETHYQLGVAQGFNSQFEEAEERLNCAIKIIKERIKNIKEAVKSPKKSPSKDGKKEITELEALVPEIEEKIADTKDMKKEAKSKVSEVIGFCSSSGDKAETKIVSSISVKRKVDEVDSKVSSIAVKRKVEENVAKKPVAEEKTAAAS